MNKIKELVENEIYRDMKCDVNDAWYSRARVDIYCNTQSRISITRDDIEKVRRSINRFLDWLYEEIKRPENKPIPIEIIQEKKRIFCNREQIELQIQNGDTYMKIAKDNNITHQRVQQIAKSMWHKRYNSYTN
jgi:tRNA threonylcarbamoyladenosine modification (KEOPS) complex  Pcc1 subunit